MIEAIWNTAVSVTENNFVYKSLSNWACNIAVGCNHACRFCYVPSAATIKQSKPLAEYGVKDPDAEWGEYVLLRPWDAHKFKASVNKAHTTPSDKLKLDGNRAIMFCSTTDPYQVFKNQTLGQARRDIMRNALQIIRDESDLNVRILTRSPLARQDFDLFKSFGHRLLLGSSIPTLNNRLAKVYEPTAPAPTQRLEMLKAARAHGLNVFVAMAPTYPECDQNDIHNSLSEFKNLEPVTIFHEPINIRAENVKRIRIHAEELGVQINTDVFSSREKWELYAINQLKTVEETARILSLNQIHLWPDKSLKSYFRHDQAWIEKWWNRISEWPTK